MPTEELKQALRAANVRGAEKDFADVLCRLFDVPRPLVVRILYAAQYASAEFGGHAHWVDTDELPHELREAISKQVKRSWRKVQLRKTIERSGTALVWIDKLIPDSESPERICKGCPKSLDCVAESLSTPVNCASGEGPIPKRFDVKPLKLNGDVVTVDCAWPEGQYVLDVEDFDL